ncbi:uncharacterized protein K460DRAFT_359529 [Cucurbitaria berberidis CBS 394.84]|uniref:Uncharacterized protein n=1 Tax=Cucurbitaria berberidis CBS 394.84 TaxID=1168544 RepID=A0A9P4G8I7_9PLEO|nr:uncharacterized protein K460DRAFT_359529 [Cucurbitaria berberidis CBS 394.84]KAF1840991.1 hypothetical protein K460DRAFT_359529 [Cucurbitaria berberidis CBS 394.84]
MSRSQQPDRPSQNGPSRNSHGRDRFGSRTSAQNVNDTPGNQGTSSQSEQVSRQRTSEVHDYGARDDSDPYHHSPYDNQQDYAHRQYRQYTQVTRPWETPDETPNPDLHQTVDSPALNILPRPYQPLPPTPAPSYQTRGAGQDNNERLTFSNLEDHDQRRTSTSTMRTMMRESQRAGPYDAVGYIRQDERLYEYGAYEEQDVRSHTSYSY